MSSAQASSSEETAVAKIRGVKGRVQDRQPGNRGLCLVRGFEVSWLLLYCCCLRLFIQVEVRPLVEEAVLVIDEDCFDHAIDPVTFANVEPRLLHVIRKI